MWRRFIAAAVVHPVTVTMITLTVLVFGAVAVERLPVELLPELAFPTLTVRTELPDSAPQEVEELVTHPVEERVSGVPGIVSVEAVSREGHSDIVLEFAWGTSIDQALADVREKLDRVTLPPRALRPLVLRYDPSQEPVVRLGLRQALAGPPDARDRSRLRHVAETTVQRALEKVTGVAAVEVHGGEEDEIAVLLESDKLAAFGLASADVVQAITRANVNRPGGAVDEGDQRFLVRTLHETRTPEDIGAVVVRSTGDGAILRVRDVATVRRQGQEREELRLLAGHEAVELDIYREGDANIVDVAHAVLEAVAELETRDDIELVVLSNRATFIESAIATVGDNVIWGGCLAVLVLLFFLRNLRSTVVIAVAIPTSVVATFIPLQLLDVSLNIMSLGGLALGVGMLTDNSIVVLESVARREHQAGAGADIDHIITEGTAEVAPAVFASTMTTVAVFFPIAFVEGVAGQLVRDLSYTVSLSIVSSLFVSLTLIPVLLKVGRGVGASESTGAGTLRLSFVYWLIWPLAKLSTAAAALLRILTRTVALVGVPLDRGYRGLEDLYPRLLRRALALRGFVIAAILATCLGAGALAAEMPRTLLPELVEDEFTVQVSLPSGASLERSARLLRTLQRAADADPAIARSFARVGRLRVPGQAQGVRLGSHLGELSMTLVPTIADAEEIRAAQERVLADLRRINPEPDAEFRLARPSLLETAPPLEVRVFAEDPRLLSRRAEALAHELEALAQVEEVAADDLRGRPEVDLAFDRERLERLGLSVEDVATAVERAVAGEVATRVFASDQQLDVRVRLPADARSDRDQLGDVVVGIVEGVPIRLRAVADLEPATGPAQLRRLESRRGMRISAQSSTSDLEATRRAVAARLADDQHPGVETVLAGQADDMDRSLDSLMLTTALSLFLVYGVMASTFESLMHPFLIMFTAPIAAAGAVFMAWALAVPLSSIVGIGLIVLAGIVVNNAIVLVDAINLRRGRGEGLQAAIVDASSTRLRPIAMTTMTTIVGLVPMALGFGDATAIRQPLAVSVIGGLGFATLLTLVLLPCLYSLVPGPVRKAWRS